jgi:hypothetical protein
MIRYAIRRGDPEKVDQLVEFYLAYGELFTTIGQVKRYNEHLSELMEELDLEDTATVAEIEARMEEVPRHIRLRDDETSVKRVRQDLKRRRKALAGESSDSAPALLWEGGGRLYRSIKSVNQFFLPATVLMHHVADSPRETRTEARTSFVEQYAQLVKDELINSVLERSGKIPGSKVKRESLLEFWKRLAQVDVREAPPGEQKKLSYKDYYWLLTANAVSLLSLHSRSPELCAFTDDEVRSLEEIASVGLDYFLSKITEHRITNWEGEEVPAATFGEGDWTHYWAMTYAGDRGEESPRGSPPPPPVENITMDTGHIWQRMPKVLDVISTHLPGTGVARYQEELDAAAEGMVNYFLYRTVHFADGDPRWPLAKNYSKLDGWFRVDYPSRPLGYPPSWFTEKVFLDLGTLAGWNPDLRELLGRLADVLASDDERDVAYRKRWFSEDFFVEDGRMGVDAWRMLGSIAAPRGDAPGSGPGRDRDGEGGRPAGGTGG